MNLRVFLFIQDGGFRMVTLQGRVFKIYKTPRLVERRQLPLKGAHI